MGGTHSGGIQASLTNKAKYGDDFYVVVGGKGGRAPCRPNAGFKNKARARSCGRVGGLMSRRGYKLSPDEKKAVRVRYGLESRDYLAEEHNEARERMKNIARRFR